MGLYWNAAALLCLASGADAWNDIAGALTYKGTSHVFQVRSPASLTVSLRLSVCLPLVPYSHEVAACLQGCPGGGQPDA